MSRITQKEDIIAVNIYVTYWGPQFYQNKHWKNKHWKAYNSGKLQYSLLYSHSTTNIKISKKKSELKYIIDQLDLIDICEIFYPTVREYTFFSVAYEIFSNINLIISHKESLTDKKYIFKKKKEMRWLLISFLIIVG